MNLPNRNPETGIRYGYISAQSLRPEVIDELQQRGVDIHWQEAMQELEDGIRAACEGYMGRRAIQSVVDEAMEHAGGDNWCDDEPVHEGEHEGVHYRTSWLGGALHVWVFKSAIVKKYQECSPCVPGAGNLDCPDEEGVETYDVPEDWRWRDEN